MKILVFGSCNIDRTYTVGHFVGAGETLAADKVEEFVGGKGLNQAIALSRAGSDVYFAGAVGADGAMLQRALCDSGINTDYLMTTDGMSGHAIIQIDGTGENCILLCAGANREISDEYAREVLSHFGCGDVLLLQNEISAMPTIVHEAAERGMKVYLNPSPYDAVISSLDMCDVDTLILNRVELSMLCEAQGIESSDSDRALSRLLYKYPHLKLMLTLGRDGCAYMDAQSVAFHSIYEVKTVDTTGAGDTFGGYFIASVERGEGIEQALSFACAASAISVTRKGASPSIPTRAEVEGFMAERDAELEFTEEREEQV